MDIGNSVKNYPSALRESANFAYRGIKKMCKDIGPRAPGSEEEKKAQEFIAEELKKSCSSVEIEEFSVHPDAFLGWVRICAVLAVIATIMFNIGFAPVSLILLIASIGLIISDFVLYKHRLNPFYKKKTSRNCIGVISPAKEVKRRIILSGHADSSKEWTFLYLGGPVLLKLVLVSVVVFFIAGIAASIIAIARGFLFKFTLFGGEDKLVKILGFVLLGFLPVIIAAFFFENRKRPVCGANDNLTGTFASLAVAKFLNDNKLNFENTEVRILITGSEESGLVGSAAYVKKHLDELKEVETVFINTDTLEDIEHMAIYNRDLSSTVKNCPHACALLKEGALKAGLDLPYMPLFFGASDAVPPSQAGLSAVTLAAMDPAPARYYHTRRDTEELLDLKTIEKGIDILIQTTLLFDEKGLKPAD